ncbi:hypothetical protein ZWY2020_039453 [Hordeum vulgare]|nr:hypothetical protein ZWY2020_039453 [Hordeum vulgare]
MPSLPSCPQTASPVTPHPRHALPPVPSGPLAAPSPCPSAFSSFSISSHLSPSFFRTWTSMEPSTLNLFGSGRLHDKSAENGSTPARSAWIRPGPAVVTIGAPPRSTCSVILGSRGSEREVTMNKCVYCGRYGRCQQA